MDPFSVLHLCPLKEENQRNSRPVRFKMQTDPVGLVSHLLDKIANIDSEKTHPDCSLRILFKQLCCINNQGSVFYLKRNQTGAPGRKNRGANSPPDSSPIYNIRPVLLPRDSGVFKWRSECGHGSRTE